MRVALHSTGDASGQGLRFEHVKWGCILPVCSLVTPGVGPPRPRPSGVSVQRATFNTDSYMVDQLHEKATSSDSEAEASADLDVKVEQLLLAGLDHYFQEEYDRAIDLWGRVLFLDRQHARARAYIERARAAAAERIRESEELLHIGTEAFKRGNADEARALLNSAAARGRDEALPMLDRLTRLETAAGRPDSPSLRMRSGRVMSRESTSAPTVERGAHQVRHVRMVPLVVLVVALLAGAYVALSWDRIEALWFVDPSPRAVGPVPVWQGTLPVPSQAVLRFERAQRLVAAGETRAALALLRGIESGDPRRADADDLSATIQSSLLGLEDANGAESLLLAPR